ncbi:mitogen-activated protein kinase kinase kinase 18 [Cynara cardunculus var. scolymus]|uniref:mitogen-activated protein kinase kinase kinase 18 n=1 Tax=Cynara cardunculus var. scolymus TaxID=59895 RepID=UPI000D62FC45|nr:mitogen-activated protein kinase kinase kinase 18 [Cynara cardunculus var. scolymus]
MVLEPEPNCCATKDAPKGVNKGLDARDMQNPKGPKSRPEPGPKIRSPNWVRGLCIGRGSFGTVSLAVDKSDGRRFAVKSVEETSGRFSQALENEIRILKSLSSPYVVEYLGDDFTSELSSVVYRNLHMEYMPGGTVADMAEQGEDATVRNYTRCVVSALSYIHRKNIVHCDVKGKNVLIGENPGAAKLADFGSAVEMSGPISGTRGSPLWMAPEVVRGEYQGPESDIWSLGCTVIEMVTGKPAWEDRGIDTLCQIGYSDELPKLPAHFSDELRDFLHKCLRRNPSERWSSDQLLQHPFLSSCSSSSSSSNSTESTTKKLSPRCVFDWSDSNFSDEETSEMKKSTRNLNSSDAKRRMGILSCNSAAANWESDGWELVRNAAEEGGPTSTEEERSWQEDGYSDEEGGGGFDDDDGGANNHADGTSDGWSNRDTYNNYSCCMYVSLRKSLLFNRNAIRHIYLFSFNFIPDFEPFLLHYFHINYLPTIYLLFISKQSTFGHTSLPIINTTITYILIH